MSTFGYAYRERLRQFIKDGSFSSEPAREKVLLRFVNEWEKWAQLASAQQKKLKWAEKWLWAGMIPSFCVMCYAIFVMGRRTDAQFKVLCEAQDAVTNYRTKYGASSVENEALKSIWAERGV